MRLDVLSDCPVCFRILFEIGLLVFQTTPSLLGLLSSLSPGDSGALPFPLCSLLPTGSSLLSQELSPLIISHPELTPYTQSFSILMQNSIQVMLFFAGVQFPFLHLFFLLLHIYLLGHTKYSEALDGFLLCFFKPLSKLLKSRPVKIVNVMSLKE